MSVFGEAICTISAFCWCTIIFYTVQPEIPLPKQGSYFYLSPTKWVFFFFRLWKLNKNKREKENAFVYRVDKYEYTCRIGIHGHDNIRVASWAYTFVQWPSHLPIVKVVLLLQSVQRYLPLGANKRWKIQRRIDQNKTFIYTVQKIMVFNRSFDFIF